MAKSKITSKGQLTLPVAVRQFLKANPGDSVFFTPEEDGSVNMRRLPRSVSVEELAGVLGRDSQSPVDLDAARVEALQQRARRLTTSSDRKSDTFT